MIIISTVLTSILRLKRTINRMKLSEFKNVSGTYQLFNKYVGKLEEMMANDDVKETIHVLSDISFQAFKLQTMLSEMFPEDEERKML